MGIDLDFLTDTISGLNVFFTNLARSEQMKEINEKKDSSKKASETDEDVSSTTVKFSCAGGKISADLDTNANNTDSVWKNNFYIMAQTLIPGKVTELISANEDRIVEQLKPYIENLIGGAFK